MAEAVLCPKCRNTVPADAPQGLCPACMMNLGLPSAIADERTIAPQTPPAAGEETVAPPDEGFTTAPAQGAAPASADVPGYEILGELGRGGMGVVYQAKHLTLRRVVALKMILGGGHAGTAELERFRTEAEAIARLQHPNIVQIHEIGEHVGLPYFSLEFCGGGSLERKLAATPQEPRQAAALVEKLARAMQAAHAKGVIHRDLKPANVLLAEDGTPKITDFGLAKKLDEAGRTQDGSVMGTPSYMAPEQAGGKSKELGPACDIYALGAILYELLTGRPPFKAATPLDTVLQVVSDEPVPPSQLQHTMPHDVETICLKCLQKDPAKRYASAQALADDLRRYYQGEPIMARPVGTIERVVKWVKRRPMVAGLIAAVVVFALVAFAGVSGGFGWALVERENAIGQEKKTAEALIDTKKAQKKAEEEKTIAQEERKKAEKLAQENRLLADKADERREHAETLAVRIEFEQHSSRTEDRPDLALVGLASLLPPAARLKDQRLAASVRLHIAALSEHAARLSALYPLQDDLQELGSLNHHYYALALSADLTTVLTVSDDNKARLWNLATGKSMGPPLRLQGVANAVALSADGKTALTGSRDKTARLWDLATGKPIGPPLQHQEAVQAVALSADGKTALTGCFDKTAQLWETATGKPIGAPLQHQDRVDAVALSADGKTALTASRDRTARLWNATTGKPIGSPLQHQSPVSAVALSADGKTALTGSFDGALLWETINGAPIGPPLEHQGRQAWAVALSADGKKAVTASDDGTARLWETATGEPIGLPLRHGDAVMHVALSFDGKTALTASRENLVRLWKTALGKPIVRPLHHQDFFAKVAMSADGKVALSTDTGDTARLWDTANGKLLVPPLQHKDQVFAVALSADGKTALTGSSSGTARLWDTGTGKPIGSTVQHKDTVAVVALSADGKTALTSSVDGTSRLWETATGKPIGPKPQLQKSVLAMALSFDGTTAVAIIDNKVFRLLETATGKPIGTPLQRPGRVAMIALSGDAKIALTGSFDKTARLWEMSTGKPIGPPLQHQHQVLAVALSADGKSALTGSEDGTTRMWETASGKQVGPPLLHQGKVTGVALSADGKTALAVAGKTSRLWLMPQPMNGDPERIKLWAQVITGLEADELTAVHVLDADTWQQRRQQLDKLGKPPQN